MTLITGPWNEHEADLLKSLFDGARQDDALPEWASLIRSGDSILDVPRIPPAVWGDDEEILWAAGQAAIIAGHDGVGKTTLAGELVRGRLALGSGAVLGLPVRPGIRNLLYLAMDRPQQAKAALARLFTEADRDALKLRLRIWEGPPPEDLARNPGLLAEMCRAADADTCVIDSLKDAAIGLREDEIGAGWNRARQAAIVGGTEMLELHHPRKPEAAATGKAPELADLYGSRWIPAGAGSVIILHGSAGDPVVRLFHRKPVLGEVGPWDVRIDGASGEVSIHHGGVDLLEQIRLRGSHGITATVAAALLFGPGEDPKFRPTANQAEKARGRLKTMEKKGLIVGKGGSQGGGRDREEAKWFLAERG